MNFFEQELRRIVGERFPDAVYVGRLCYLPLRGGNRAKLCFRSGIYADHYDRLEVSIIRPDEGMVDQMSIRFSDVFETKGHNCSGTTAPYIWDDNGEPHWYVQPSSWDFTLLTNSIRQYVGLFQEPLMKRNPFHEPSMTEQTM